MEPSQSLSFNSFVVNTLEINYPDSGGGCCGGSSGGGGLTNTEALIFLAALAFAVAFLNQQITMFLGGEGRLKRKRREESNNHDPFNESKFPIYYL